MCYMPVRIKQPTQGIVIITGPLLVLRIWLTGNRLKPRVLQPVTRRLLTDKDRAKQLQ